MAQPLSFRWDEEFVERIDEFRGDVPRSVFVRRAVEREMADPSPQQRARWTAKSGGAYDSHPEVVAESRRKKGKRA